jgi:hypothetical protein
MGLCSLLLLLSVFFVVSRSIAQHLGLRECVMTLLSHPQTEIRRHALLATSKLMISQWAFLQQPSSSQRASRRP